MLRAEASQATPLGLQMEGGNTRIHTHLAILGGLEASGSRVLNHENEVATLLLDLAVGAVDGSAVLAVGQVGRVLLEIARRHSEEAESA